MTYVYVQVPGTRFTDKYLHARMSSSRSSYYGSPYLPARPAAEKTSPVKPVAPASPPRKVVSDFKAFGASPTASVFGTAVQSTPFSLAGGKAAFGALRGNGRTTAFDDEEEEDDDDGRQRVELREDSITLDQVRTPGLRLNMSRWLIMRYVCRRAASRCRARGEVPAYEPGLRAVACAALFADRGAPRRLPSHLYIVYIHPASCVAIPRYLLSPAVVPAFDLLGHSPGAPLSTLADHVVFSSTQWPGTAWGPSCISSSFSRLR